MLPKKAHGFLSHFLGELVFFVPKQYRGQGIGSTLAKITAKHMFKAATPNTFPVIEASSRAYNLIRRTNPKKPVMNGWVGRQGRRSVFLGFPR